MVVIRYGKETVPFDKYVSGCIKLGTMILTERLTEQGMIVNQSKFELFLSDKDKRFLNSLYFLN